MDDFQQHRRELASYRYRTRRSKWIKANGPCQNCGSTENLEIDHVDPSVKDKKLRAKILRSIWLWNDVRRNAELTKCQVLCHDCHVAKTVAERPPAPHGTGYMYRKGCRCQSCRDAHSAIQRELSGRKREHRKAGTSYVS